jgi:hypothetical protein
MDHKSKIDLKLIFSRPGAVTVRNSLAMEYGFPRISLQRLIYLPKKSLEMKYCPPVIADEEALVTASEQCVYTISAGVLC